VTDLFETWDGAYLLGTLSAAENEAFEEHLLTCDACAARVRELAPLPGLLAQLSEQDVRDLARPEPMPDTLLPRLLRAAQVRRRRGRALIGALATAAAACALALTVVLWPTGTTSLPAAEAMRVLIPGAPLHATVRLIPQRWGTEIDMRCSYAEYGSGATSYVLVAYSRKGVPQRLGGWSLAPGETQTFHPPTSLRADQIGRLVLQLPNGRPVLELDR
jgi:hypothetical protein